jgi:hypothetical protein
MATVQELFAGRSQTLKTGQIPTMKQAEIPYLVTDCTSEAAALSAGYENTPAKMSGMSRQSIEIAEHVNATTYKITVRYERTSGSSDSAEKPEPQFSFDTGGGNQHITQSISTVGKYGPGVSPKLGGAIGFDGENINGVDIVVPQFSFSETHYVPAATVTDAYMSGIFSCTGKTNAGAFRGFAEGEVLFLGASGSRQGADPDDDWEISFKFAASPNRNGITVGDIGGISKKGWEYLWVQYAAAVDNGPGLLIKKPIAVYVEKVYESTGFDALGLG